MSSIDNSNLSSRSPRRFRIILVFTLVVLSVQAWFGDYVAIFLAPATGITPPPFGISGLFSAVGSLGVGALYHASEGIFLVLLSAVVLALSFKWTTSKGARVAATLGFLFVISAAVGGFEFAMSGFSDGGNSAQMGGSFIAAYAMFFIALYYSK